MIPFAAELAGLRFKSVQEAAALDENEAQWEQA